VAYLLTTVAGILTHLYVKSISFWISCGLLFFVSPIYVYFKYLRSSGINKPRIFVYSSDFQMSTVQRELEPARSASAESIANPKVLRAVEKLSTSREIIQVLWQLRVYDRNIIEYGSGDGILGWNTIQSLNSRRTTSLNSDYCPGQRGFEYTGPFNALKKVQCTVAGSKRGTKSPYGAPRPLLKG
jgi:hypothetical protein